MTGKDPWTDFLETGSVIDYLKYAFNKGSGVSNSQEEQNEVSNERSDNTRNEYR